MTQPIPPHQGYLGYYTSPTTCELVQLATPAHEALEAFDLEPEHPAYPGRGVRTTAAIPKGTNMGSLGGMFIHTAMHPPTLSIFRIDLEFGVDTSLYGNLLSLINDPRGTRTGKPNLYASPLIVPIKDSPHKLKTVGFRASRDIEKGEEITTNYGHLRGFERVLCARNRDPNSKPAPPLQTKKLPTKSIAVERPKVVAVAIPTAVEDTHPRPHATRKREVVNLVNDGDDAEPPSTPRNATVVVENPAPLKTARVMDAVQSDDSAVFLSYEPPSNTQRQVVLSSQPPEAVPQIGESADFHAEPFGGSSGLSFDQSPDQSRGSEGSLGDDDDNEEEHRDMEELAQELFPNGLPHHNEAKDKKKRSRQQQSPPVQQAPLQAIDDVDYYDEGPAQNRKDGGEKRKAPEPVVVAKDKEENDGEIAPVAAPVKPKRKSKRSPDLTVHDIINYRHHQCTWTDRQPLFPGACSNGPDEDRCMEFLNYMAHREADNPPTSRDLVRQQLVKGHLAWLLHFVHGEKWGAIHDRLQELGSPEARAYGSGKAAILMYELITTHHLHALRYASIPTVATNLDRKPNITRGIIRLHAKELCTLFQTPDDPIRLVDRLNLEEHWIQVPSLSWIVQSPDAVMTFTNQTVRNVRNLSEETMQRVRDAEAAPKKK